jgi:hypothetical protein
MSLIIIESSFDPPLTEEQFLERVAAKVSPCLDERGARWITSYMATDGRRRICVFEARDAEAVRQAFRLSGLKPDRVWSAEQVLDDDDDDE